MRMTLKERNKKLSQAKLSRKNVEYYCLQQKNPKNANYKSPNCTGKSSSPSYELKDVVMKNLKSQLKLNFLKGLKLQKQWKYSDQESKLPKAHDVPEQCRKEKRQKHLFLNALQTSQTEDKIPSVYSSTQCSQPSPFFQLLYTISTW